MVLGFGGGLLLDLVPPADHVAGRWALALLVAGYLSGRVGGRLSTAGPRHGAVATLAGAAGHRGGLLVRRRPRSSSSPGWSCATRWSAYRSCSRRCWSPLVCDVLLGARARPARSSPSTSGSSPTACWHERQMMPRRRRPQPAALVVVQALVFSLFATLLVRLWYLQVATGEEYTAQAASQSVREIVVQPQRGLIVDDQGRPLVTNRTSWVVSIDRGTLAKMPDDEQSRGAPPGGQGDRRQRSAGSSCKLLTCGEDGQQARDLLERLARSSRCRSRSTSAAGGTAGARAARGLPGSAGRPGERARLPSAVRHQPRARARLPQPDHRRRARHLRGGRRPIGQRRVGRRSRRCREAVRRLAAGHARLHARWPWTRWAGSSGTATRSLAQGGDTLVTSIDAKVQGVVEQQLAGAIAAARAHQGPGHQAQLRRRLGRGRRHGGLDGPHRVDGQPADVRPRGLGRRRVPAASSKELYSEKAGTPLLGRATQGQFAPGSTWKPFMTAGALSSGYSRGHRAQLLVLPAGRQPRLQELRVGRLRLHLLRAGPRGLVQHVLLPGRARLLAALRLRRRRREGQDPLVEAAKAFGFGKETGIDLPGEAAGPDRRPAVEARLLRGDEGLLLRAAARRTATTSCTGSRASSASRATPTGPVTRSTSRSARATRSSRRSSSRAGYAAISNGGTLYAPRVAKAVVSGGRHGAEAVRAQAQSAGSTSPSASPWTTSTTRCSAYPRSARLAWKFPDFPLDQVQIRGKTGSAEVYGKQSTSWVATYDENYVVVMMISQGGTGSGTSGEAVRAIWEALYGVRDGVVRPAHGRHPGHRPARRTPHLRRGRRDPAALPQRIRGGAREPAPASRLAPPGRRAGAAGALGAAGLVGHRAPRRPHRRRLDGVPAQAAGQHRDRPGPAGRGHRDRPPLGADRRVRSSTSPRSAAWSWC